MKQTRRTAFDETRDAMALLAEYGMVDSRQAIAKLKEGSVPTSLYPQIRKVWGSSLEVKRVLAAVGRP